MLFMPLMAYPSSNIYLISEVSKEKGFQGDIIKVYGYVYDNYKKENLPVRVFLNGKLVGDIRSDKNGYFETYLKLDKVGINLIEVRYKNENNIHKVIILKPLSEVDVEDESYYSRVIILGSKKEKIYVNHIDNQYVDVEVSKKEVYVNKFGGSVVKVHIYNHLNTSSAFSVEIDGLKDDEYYTSGTLELKPLERGSIVVYLTPHKEEINKEIIIKVKNNGKVIGEKHLRLLITKKERSENIRGAFLNIPALTIISLGLIFGGIVLFIYGLTAIKYKEESVHI